jgi:hypothetical protein
MMVATMVDITMTARVEPPQNYFVDECAVEFSAVQYIGLSETGN